MLFFFFLGEEWLVSLLKSLTCGWILRLILPASGHITFCDRWHLLTAWIWNMSKVCCKLLWSLGVSLLASPPVLHLVSLRFFSGARAFVFCPLPLCSNQPSVILWGIVMKYSHGGKYSRCFCGGFSVVIFVLVFQAVAKEGCSAQDVA